MKAKRAVLWNVLIVLVVLLAACTGGASPPTATPADSSPPTPTAKAASGEPTPTPSAAPSSTPTSPPAPPSPTPSPTLDADALACEAGGYPCLLSEMSEDAVTRAAALSQDAEARMRGGDSAFEVAEWLAAQEDVVVEITDGRAIIYRVADSVPIVVEHPGVEGVARRLPAPTLGALAPASLGRAALIPRALAPETRSQPIISDPTDVAGSQRDDRNVKRALALAPYRWEVGANGDAIVAAQLLGATRWYKNRVTYIANEQQSDQNVTVQDFMNWDQYDAIHVNTHGRSLCPEEGGVCMTYLMTGHRIQRSELDAYVAEHPDIRGVGIGLRERGEAIELVVFGDFFRSYYGAGSLKNKVIYFSACEILVQSDILHGLSAAAENSDLFAWTYSVYADDALAAARAVYERMAKEGQSAGDAYERVPDDLKFNRRSHAAEYEYFRLYGVEEDETGRIELIDRTQTTDLQHHTLGQETNHVREVITLLHPETQQVLQPGAVYPINGTLGDGEPERIELMFRVEGYTQQEIENEELTISFVLDGAPIVAYRSFLPADDEHTEVQAEGEFTWRVQFEEIEIPDQQPVSEVVFRAELTLPGGDPSVHEIDPVLTSQRDVRAIFGQPPLVSGQSYTIALDRDSQVARADLAADGQQFVLYYDQETGLGYYPTPEGVYWTVEGAMAEALVAPLIPVDWPVRRLEEGGFVRESYPCGDEQCDRYHARQGGAEMVLSYDERNLLVLLQLSSPEGGGTIRYQYEPVDIAAPANAVPAPAPFPFAPPSLPIPDLP